LEGKTSKLNLEGLDALLVKAFNENVMPGTAVAVVHEGKVVYSRNFGYANLEKEEPVSSATIFRIMSISKTFTAIAVMQLWEKGLLDLDEPVNLYLKALKVQHRDPAAPPITFRHLLTHTSGIGEMRNLRDHFRKVGGLGADPASRILSMPEYYNGLLRPDTYPGEKYAYANHAYAVLAQAIEDISGEPFAMYMRAHIFEPLEMLHSDYFMSERVRGNQAQGYIFKKGRFEPYPYLRLNTPGCGGIFSCIDDMVKYVTCLMNGGKTQHGRILNAETLRLMITPQLEMDPRVYGMGFGFVLKQYGPYTAARHGGGWPGFITEMTVIPEKKLAVLVFNNSSSRGPALIAADMVYHLLGVPNPDSALPNPNVLSHADDWADLCGFYGPKPGLLTNMRIWEGYSGEVEVYVKDGKLMARTLSGPLEKGAPLYRADEDRLYFRWLTGKSATPLLFRANRDGQISGMDLMQYALYKRPLRESLKFRVCGILGILAGLTLFGIGRKIIKTRKSQE